MKHPIRTLLVIIAVAILIYMSLDRWQQGVTIYASTCETSSGTPLPMSVCKAIVKYRYETDD